MKEFLGVLVMLSGCGKVTPLDNSSKKGTGEITFNTGKSSGKFSLQSANRCNLDSKSMFLEVKLTGGNNEITLNIRGLRATAAQYTCTQSADNVADGTVIGAMFDNCMVRLAVVGEDKVGAEYAIARKDTSEPRIPYKGNCSIQIQEIRPQLKGAILCDGMPMMVKNGIALREPTGTEADIIQQRADWEKTTVSGNFGCELPDPN